MQFFPMLESMGIEPVLLPLHTPAYVEALNAGKRDWREVLKAYWRRLQVGRTLRGVDVVWVEKELLPMLPYALEERLLGRARLLLDFDDAIFHNYDLSRRPLVRSLLGDKIDHLMRRAQLVTVGNAYLGRRAQTAGARRIEFLPSVIDLQRYPEPQPGRRLRRADEPLRIVWIGSPSTAPYLEIIRGPLQRLAARHPLTLDVIGATAPVIEGVETRSLAWSESEEARMIEAADVGVMPLHDTPWEQGKCSFKLIQYMACGLPVVASAVGSNVDVVGPEHGFLVQTEEQWEQALQALIEAPELGRRMGDAGRLAVAQRYCTAVVGRRLGELLLTLD